METIAVRSVRVQPGWLVTAPASVLLFLSLPPLVGLLEAALVRGMQLPWMAQRSARSSRATCCPEDDPGTTMSSSWSTAGSASALRISHIEEGRAAATAVDAPPLELLDRKERSIDRWRKALESMMLQDGGFRGVALGRAELDDVLADPKARLERRVAAALALRSNDNAAQKRIRVAAATSADPRVRVALEAAAADEIDDRELAHALEETAPEPLRASPASRDRASRSAGRARVTSG